MNAAPLNVDIKAIEQALTNLQGVQNIHHLHIWHIDETEVSLECHLVTKDMSTVQKAAHLLHEKFNIHHTNIQIENIKSDCQPCHL